MRSWIFLPIIVAGLAFDTAAQDATVVAQPAFQLPIDCSLGKDCWISRYSDRKKGKGKADYMCGRRTQHNHRGTDFSITNYGQMKKGVAVLAAAGGTVLRLRDNVADQAVSDNNLTAVRGKECGNGIILEHTADFTTGYCHMKNASLTVKVGDTVVAGQKIGEVGLSGNTEYPHLHFNVMKKGKRIDPFDGKALNQACGAAEGNGLWAKKPIYETMDLLPLVFSSEVLNRQTRWSVQPTQFSSTAPALILTGRAWNVLEGDHWLFHIIRPDGVEATERSLTAKENRQSQWYANRLFRPKGGFMTGTWKGKLVVLRQHSDGTVSRFESETSILVRN